MDTNVMRAAKVVIWAGRPGALAALLALLAPLPGCMMGPDYARPTASDPAAFKEAAGWKIAQPQDNAPRGKWWEVFGDAKLDELEAQVDISNQNIKAAEANVRQARALTQVARAALFPAVNADAAATRSKPPAGGRAVNRPGIANTYNVALDASWEIDLWGSIRRNVEASEASAQASVANLAAATLSAQALLAQDYWLLRVADAEIALLSATVAAYEKSLQLTQNQYAVGVAGRNDVVQAETQLKSTQAQALDAGVQRAQLEHAIAILIGKAPAEVSIAVEPMRWTFPDIPPGVPSELLERRPDIASAERGVVAANAQIGVAEAAFFPSLTLSAAGGYQSSSFARLFSLPNQYWSLGAAVAQAIFDAGLRRAQKAQAIAVYDQTVANYRQTVLTGFQEVEDSLVALRVFEQEATVQDGAVKAARESVTITNNQYKAGTTSYLAVVVVQAAALNNERTALDILGRRLTASVGLIKALGGGWNASALAQAQP
jgi:NodT family efflux transporter outer membrane factor (OMF) lipoprotein